MWITFNYLIIMAPIKQWDILGSSLEVDVLQAWKTGKQNVLSELWWLDDWVRACVPGMQWLVSAKNGLKDNGWTSNRVMGDQGSLICMVSKGQPICSESTEEHL